METIKNAEIKNQNEEITNFFLTKKGKEDFKKSKAFECALSMVHTTNRKDFGFNLELKNFILKTIMETFEKEYLIESK